MSFSSGYTTALNVGIHVMTSTHSDESVDCASLNPSILPAWWKNHQYNHFDDVVQDNDATDHQSGMSAQPSSVASAQSALFYHVVDGLWPQHPKVQSSSGEIVSRFQPVEVVFEGDSARVLRAIDGHDGSTVAMKVAKDNSCEHFHDELRSLLRLKHANVVNMLSYFIDDTMTIVLEFAEKTFLDILTDDDGVSEDMMQSYTRQGAQGLAYVHSLWILHNDVKPDNMLIFGQHLKLCDFGLARFRGSTRYGKAVGTLPYMAPELLKINQQFLEAERNRPGDGAQIQYEHRPEHDVWAFAIVVFAVLIGDLPWEKASIEDGSYFAHLNSDPLEHELASVLDPLLFNILTRALDVNSEARPSMEEIVDAVCGPWLRSAESAGQVQQDSTGEVASAFTPHTSSMSLWAMDGMAPPVESSASMYHLQAEAAWYALL